MRYDWAELKFYTIFKIFLQHKVKPLSLKYFENQSHHFVYMIFKHLSDGKAFIGEWLFIFPNKS